MRHRLWPAAPPDWRHRRGLAFVELLEHLPTDHLHSRPPPPSWSPSSTASSRRRRPPASTPATPTPPEKPAAWPGMPGSPAVLGRLTSAARPGRENHAVLRTTRSPSGTTRDLRRSADVRVAVRPVAELLHRNPGVGRRRPQQRRRRYATTTTNASTTTPTTTTSNPTARSHSAGARDDRGRARPGVERPGVEPPRALNHRALNHRGFSYVALKGCVSQPVAPSGTTSALTEVWV